MIDKLRIVGKEIVTSRDIKCNSVQFYENLFKKSDIKQEDMEKYLNEFKFAYIPENGKHILNKEIDMEEILMAINNMKKNKAPGPDGFPAIFYKRRSMPGITPTLGRGPASRPW